MKTEKRFCEIHETMCEMRDEGYWQFINKGLSNARKVWISDWICPEYELSRPKAFSPVTYHGPEEMTPELYQEEQ